MFQLPQRMALKRHRDDEDSPAADVRSEKKQRSGNTHLPPHDHTIQPRPLSLSQGQVHSPCLPALTPGHSDESGCDSPDLPAYADTDMQDCAEDDFGVLRSNPHSPAVPFMLPERLNPRPHHDPNTGRIPTPIYGHFPPKITQESSDISSMDLEDFRAAAINARRSLAQHRDMPSPISEDEMAMTPTTMAGNRLSRLHVSGDDGMDMDSPTFPPPRSNSNESKSGRNRSGAITGKKKFQMGFREDCPKCQARVPGHNAHFLPC